MIKISKSHFTKEELIDYGYQAHEARDFVELSKFDYLNLKLNKILEMHVTTCRVKGWYEEPQKFAESIALLHTEPSEALQTYRSHGFDIDKEEYEIGNDIQHYIKNEVKPQSIGSDLADTILRALDIAHRNSIDIEFFLKMKLLFNATRKYRHGDKIL